MSDITKIDDSTIGIIQPLAITDIKRRISDHNEAIINAQKQINDINEKIVYMQSLIDKDSALLKQASDIGVADAVVNVNAP